MRPICTGENVDAGELADAAMDAPPLQAAITECHRRVDPAPDDGVTTNRQVVVACTATARRCHAVVSPTTGSPPPQPFSFTLGPSGHGDEWLGEPFLPAP